ncbi:IS66-like element ISHwa11 family transposase [Haloquadratum walsbyi]|uniref:ISH10-type transposase ISHwa11 n=1 Tax=Haloquadratum walsbyi (strain DSM 16854 / JCM 12705 / C23) TaxID=768065 RepID=G0LM61_HALWC|nr:IS66-like element ISHwa11 family transposase [Haloquadratum walsbyi]CCC41181.1 ISH10-type transposase ISHwa11 [Haloquadratum walsbyi C23]
MSLRSRGSTESTDSVIRTDDSSLLRQQLVIKELENRFLRRQITTQQQEIEQLEARLKQYENPNTPPSKQGGAAKSPGRDDQDGDEDEESEEDDAGGDPDAASDSSPGRSEGHEGTTRPPPEPEETIRVDQGYCPDCEQILSNPENYVSQTVIDVPLPVPTTVVKYELGKHHCSCGNEVVAEHPDCPKKGRFGPNIMAQTALSRFHQRLPNRKQAELFDWELDHPVSHRTIYNLTKRVADRLRPAYNDIKEKIRESNVVYCDETGFPVDGEQHWAWTFVTDDEVLFWVDESRGSGVLEDVLGEEFAEDSTLSCDGWSAYSSYHTKLQRCWAHLSREAEYVAERYEEAERLSEELHALHDDLTTFVEGEPSASAREQKRAEASLHLEGLIREDYEVREVQQLIKKISNGLGHWLTFMTEPGVDSTNNRAERALREQVVLRKMFRTLRSAEGVQIHETITTMLATWKRRGLDPPEQLQSILGGRELR